jgi:hypothetical protein
MIRATPDTLTESIMLLAGAAVLIVILLGPAASERPPAGLRTAIELISKKSPSLQSLSANGLKSVSRS